MRNRSMLRFAAASVIVLSAAAHAAEISDAAKSALRSEKALGKNKFETAVTEAEAAVAAAPPVQNRRAVRCPPARHGAGATPEFPPPQCCG